MAIRVAQAGPELPGDQEGVQFTAISKGEGFEVLTGGTAVRVSGVERRMRYEIGLPIAHSTGRSYSSTSSYSSGPGFHYANYKQLVGPRFLSASALCSGTDNFSLFF